jgi:hypothetical protein
MPLKRTLLNVGLPDKFHPKASSYLPMPPDILGFPPNPKVLGAYATPDFSTLMPLFLLLFPLIFTAFNV